MNEIIRPVLKINGQLELPGDKSISHRALIFSAMCDGDVTISGLSTAADCMSTISCLRQLGVRIEETSDSTYNVHGCGRFGFIEPDSILNAGNSGTTMRLLSGLLAGQLFYSIIDGDESLRCRPMRRIIKPLSAMGAQIFARDNNRLPPLTIVGRKLNPIRYEMPIASAQVKSAIMISGLLCEGETTITENIISRDHTERMLKFMGVDITVNDKVINLHGGDLSADEIFVPGDISSALFFIVAVLLTESSNVIIKNVGLNPTRIGAIKILQKMGAEINIKQTGVTNGEPYGEISAVSSILKPITITGGDIPSMIDEVPIISLAATQVNGKTIISGAGELRFKESDRLRTVADGLTRLGAMITEKEDGLEIEGPVKLVGCDVDSFGDHRLAMTMAIAGLIARGKTIVHNTDAVAISFPDFFKQLQTLTGYHE